MPQAKNIGDLTAASTAGFIGSTILASAAIADAYFLQWLTKDGASGVAVWVLWLLAIALVLRAAGTALTRFAVERRRLDPTDTRRNLARRCSSEVLWFTVLYALLAVEVAQRIGVRFSNCTSDAWWAGIQILTDKLIKTLTLDLFELAGVQFATCTHNTKWGRQDFCV